MCVSYTPTMKKVIICHLYSPSSLLLIENSLPKARRSCNNIYMQRRKYWTFVNFWVGVNYTPTQIVKLILYEHIFITSIKWSLYIMSNEGCCNVQKPLYTFSPLKASSLATKVELVKFSCWTSRLPISSNAITILWDEHVIEIASPIYVLENQIYNINFYLSMIHPFHTLVKVITLTNLIL